MTLTFTQENGLYVAEFEATAPFSIHLERPKGGFINMLQRSVDSGTFVAVKNFNPNYNATQVIDADCGQGAVYPKWIRLESAVEPSVAEVTFESESSGGGAGTESTMEYLDLRSYDLSSNDLAWMANVYMLATLVNINQANSGGGNMKGIFTYGIYTFMGLDVSSLLAVGLEENLTITNPVDGAKISIKELLLKNITEEQYNSIPRITKEQFYSLEA